MYDNRRSDNRDFASLTKAITDIGAGTELHSTAALK